MNIVKKYLYTIIDFGTAVPHFTAHNGIMVDTNASLLDAFDFNPRLDIYNVPQPHLDSFDDCIVLLKNIQKLWYSNKPFVIYLINKQKKIDKLHVSKTDNVINVDLMQSYDASEIDMMEISTWYFLKYESKKSAFQLFCDGFLSDCKDDLGWKYTDIEMDMNQYLFDEIPHNMTHVKISIETNSWFENIKCRIDPFKENSIIICTTNRPNLCCCPYCGKDFESETLYPAMFCEIKNNFALFIHGSQELQDHMFECDNESSTCHCCGEEKTDTHIKRRSCVKKYVRQLKHGVIRR